MADADDDDEGLAKGAETAAGPAAKAPLLKCLLPYFIGGALSIGLGIGAGIVQSHRQEPHEGTNGGKKPPKTLDAFPVELKLELPKQIFNCADTGQIIAGAITIELEVRTTDKWGHPEEKPALRDAIDPKAGGRYYARMRDSLVTLLSTKVSSDLKTSKGKDVLKLEILERMNEILFSGTDAEKDPQGIVSKVLFTDFLVQ